MNDTLTSDLPIRFIHIKKNGGTSVYKFLRKNKIEFMMGSSKNGDHLANQHAYAKTYLNEKSWKFAIARNPYSRIVSFYNWCKRHDSYKDISFEEFVLHDKNTNRSKGAWNLQVEYLLDDGGNNLIDKIFYFEDFDQSIPKFFNTNTKFPHLNKSTHDDYKSYYNDHLKQKIYNHFKEDFNFFGYSETL